MVSVFWMTPEKSLIFKNKNKMNFINNNNLKVQIPCNYGYKAKELASKLRKVLDKQIMRSGQHLYGKNSLEIVAKNWKHSD